MKKNVGNIDRILRVLTGIVVISMGLYYQSWWGVAGLLPLATGLSRRCPAYLPAKWNSCKQGKC